MTKKKRILIGVSGLALVALVAGLVWWFWFMPPSKNDFVAAKTTAEKIGTYKGSALLREYTSAVSTANKEGKSYEQIIEVTQAKKTELSNALRSRTENTEKLEASIVRRDKDVDAAYGVYAEKAKKYTAYLQGYADAYPSYIVSLYACQEIFQIGKLTSDSSQYADLHKKASKDCLKYLTLLSKSSNKPFADFAKEFTRIVNARQVVFDGTKAGTLEYDAAADKITALGKDVSKNDPHDALVALSKASLFDGELTKLIKVLGEKADQAK